MAGAIPLRKEYKQRNLILANDTRGGQPCVVAHPLRSDQSESKGVPECNSGWAQTTGNCQGPRSIYADHPRLAFDSKQKRSHSSDRRDTSELNLHHYLPKNRNSIRTEFRYETMLPLEKTFNPPGLPFDMDHKSVFLKSVVVTS